MHCQGYLNTRTTSELTGISESTLEKWRVSGTGIPFVKAGRSVKYAVDDIHQWMAARRVLSTSERLSMEASPRASVDATQ